MKGRDDRFRRAVALKYDPHRDRAPKVTAKGARAIAERIIELARKEGVPLHEDPDLVGALMELDFHEEIPPQLYKAVAEILAFVYRLNRKMGK
jgi:FlhB-like protein